MTCFHCSNPVIRDDDALCCLCAEDLARQQLARGVRYGLAWSVVFGAVMAIVVSGCVWWGEAVGMRGATASGEVRGGR